MELKHMILNRIKIIDFNLIIKSCKMYIMLASRFSFIIKSLIISIFSFSTATNNAVT